MGSSSVVVPGVPGKDAAQVTFTEYQLPVGDPRCGRRQPGSGWRLAVAGERVQVCTPGTGASTRSCSRSSGGAGSRAPGARSPASTGRASRSTWSQRTCATGRSTRGTAPMRGVFGTDKARPYAAQAPAEFDPMYEYIDSDLGGYGLYYGTTMAATGLVIPALPQAGVPFDAPTSAGQRAAAAFREAIAGTTYYREYFGHPDRPVPAAVVLEYARRQCNQGDRQPGNGPPAANVPAGIPPWVSLRGGSRG